MTVASDLVTVLSGACPRVFDFAPNDAVRPYITYMQFGGPAIAHISDDGPTTGAYFFQINVHADTRAECVATLAAARTAVLGASQFVARENGRPVWNVNIDTEIRSASWDFTVWGAL